MKTRSRTPAANPQSLQIEDLSHDGRGLARRDGKVCFVAGALPGEQVEAVVERRHRRHDDYRLVRVTEAAAERIDPPCPLVGRCGGCDLQHLAARAQLEHKTRVVLDLLERRAELVPATLESPIESLPFGYRRRARLAWDVPRRGAPSLGFRGAGSRAIVAVGRCPVLMDTIESLPAALHAVLARLRRPADLGHVELAVSEAPDGTLDPVIHLHMVGNLPEVDRQALTEFASARGAYLSLGTPHADGQAGAIELLHRPRACPAGYRLPAFDLRLAFEPGDFLQGNGLVNRALVERVAGWLDGLPRGRLLDAFCGLGNFSLPLARRGFDVTGIEGVAAMVGRARANAAANGIESAAFLQRDLMAGLPRQQREVEVAVLDPPRGGAAAVVEAVARARVRHVLYVSCDPQTLARDAAVLAGSGYALDRLCLVDMFPQTSHVEAAALFCR